MTPQQLFILADKTFVNVVEQISDDQWDKKVPSYISDKGETLREVINYHLYDEIWVPDVLAGKTIEQVGSKYDGNLLGKDPIKRFKAIAGETQMIVGVFSEPDKIVHLSYGDWPAKDYLLHISYFRALRAYDIAKFIGVSTELPAELVEDLYNKILPDAENWRKMGVFGPEVKVADDADTQTKLLGITGRKA